MWSLANRSWSELYAIVEWPTTIYLKCSADGGIRVETGQEEGPQLRVVTHLITSLSFRPWKLHERRNELINFNQMSAKASEIKAFVQALKNKSRLPWITSLHGFNAINTRPPQASVGLFFYNSRCVGRHNTFVFGPFCMNQDSSNYNSLVSKRVITIPWRAY